MCKNNEDGKVLMLEEAMIQYPMPVGWMGGWSEEEMEEQDGK